MSKTSALLDLVCAQRKQMKVILALLIASGFLLGLSLLFVEPGDRSYPLLVVDLVLVVVGFAFFSTTYWYCTKRAMDE
ncbi:hypothetical protein NDI76_18750 [Halogeometricum sp. S1BR25-6]|uniref:Uncharacterized protein n=1 Tax=Halogeometricum salsisoli TaxID=2950536 RepID=A0ABU2GIY3_9EURY|nr:hypothetical protein [Halogeometricum sp. S1BR25-6]MDS0300792.1 hypothetical protein [Halogeometricum sp. S1BR25-6]